MLPTLHQHQRCTQTERGYTRGASSAHILGADYQLQESAMASPSRCAVISSLVKLGGAVKSPVPFTRIPDRRAVTPPAAAVSGACGLLHHASRTHSYGARLQPRSIIRATGLPSDTAHSAPVKPSLQFLADRVTTHPSGLSHPLVSMSPTSNRRMPKKCHFVTGSDQCMPL